MSRFIILYLGIILSISFDQIQGDFFPIKWFPKSTIALTLPDYISWICRYITVITFAWVFYKDTVKYKIEMLVAFILIIGFLIDFLIECNQGWFDCGTYAVGYRTIVIVVLGSILLKVIIQTILKSKWVGLL